MSHYRCEIILPACRANDVDAAIAEVLAPFNEDPPDSVEDHDSRSAFWDWYQIGGRWAGQHAVDRFDPQIVAKFSQTLIDRNVTVSGVQFGKQELEPAWQQAMVDELWREMFPDSGLDQCPMFQHSNPGNSGPLAGDICTVAQLGQWTSCYRLIIAGPGFVYVPDGESYHTNASATAAEMLERSYWNGVSWNDSAWDGKVLPAIERFNENLDRRRKGEYVDLAKVLPDSVAVTVDYHS